MPFFNFLQEVYIWTFTDYKKLDVVYYRFRKQQSPKTFVKIIKAYNIGKSTSSFELVGVMLYFKVSPISGKAKIANGFKSFYGFLDIIDKQTPLSENFNLPLGCYGSVAI